MNPDIERTVAGAVKGVLDSEVAKNISEKPSKELSQGIGDLIHIIFDPVRRYKLKQEYLFKQYEEEIKGKYSAIPEENRIEPKLNVAGPALEAAKYHVEEEEIRTMFATLIASSANKEHQQVVHPSFVEIIKQFSPRDAVVCKFLYENKDSIGVGRINGLFDFQNNRPPQPTAVIDNYFPFPDLTMNNHFDYQASVDNLVRLAIITIDFTKYVIDDSRYEASLNHPIYEQVEKSLSPRTDIPSTFKGITFQRGLWSFTTFGKNFVRCCYDL